MFQEISNQFGSEVNRFACMDLTKEGQGKRDMDMAEHSGLDLSITELPW